MQRQATAKASQGEISAAKLRPRFASLQMRAGSRPIQQARAGGFRRVQAR